MHGSTVLLLYLIPLLLALSSCGVIRRVEQSNATLDLKRSVRRLTQDQTGAALRAVSVVLYPVVSERSEAGDRLFATAERYGSPELQEQVALLTGHPEAVTASQDTLRRLIGAAMRQDRKELRALLEGAPDPASAATLALMEGDTSQAVEQLTYVVEAKRRYPEEVRRRAAWVLTAFPESRSKGVQLLMSLGEAGPMREWLYLLQEQEPSEERLRLLARQLPGEVAHGTVEEQGVLSALRKRLWEAALWSEALALQERIPDDAYATILDYRREIELLRAYEQPPEEVPERTERTEGRSFVDRFGAVRNVNNWAMTHRGYSPLPTAAQLTPEEYEALRRRVTEALRQAH